MSTVPQFVLSATVITRREAVCGGLVSILTGPCLCVPAMAQAGLIGGGCSVDEQEGRRILEANSTSASFLAGRDEITYSSGNKNFDQALAQTLARLVEAFDVLPAFAFFREPQGPNALASPRVLSRTDGTVLFGFNLLKLLFDSREHPDVAMSAICSHEFAHILQFKRDLKKGFSSEPNVRRAELHADLLSGYFAGLSKLRKPDYPAAVYAATMHAFGDNAPSSRSHHGVPAERSSAVVRGFELAFKERRSLDEAVRAGLDYVWRL